MRYNNDSHLLSNVGKSFEILFFCFIICIRPIGLPLGFNNFNKLYSKELICENRTKTGLRNKRTCRPEKSVWIVWLKWERFRRFLPTLATVRMTSLHTHVSTNQRLAWASLLQPVKPLQTGKFQFTRFTNAVWRGL